MLIDSAFQCCFCGAVIVSDNKNPTEVIIATNWDKPKKDQREQVFWSHLNYVKERMHDTARYYFF